MRLPSQALASPTHPGRRPVAPTLRPVPARALRPGARGCVRAVFERSFYVDLGDRWACIGSEGLGAGPLNLVCVRWPARPLAAHVRAGDVARIDAGTFFAGRVAIALGDAAPWSPARVGDWDKASLARGLAVTDAAMRRLAPRDGLALLSGEDGCPRPAPWSTLEAPLGHLDRLLAEPRAAIPPPIDVAKLAPLLGLGPGLTPSGDDYLGGLFVALSLVGSSGLRDRLWRALLPLTSERTTAISRAHLAAAAEGLGSAALHEALGTILRGSTDRIAAACVGLGRVGHTSGWDGLAGALSVLRAIQRAG